MTFLQCKKNLEYLKQLFRFANGCQIVCMLLIRFLLCSSGSSPGSHCRKRGIDGKLRANREAVFRRDKPSDDCSDDRHSR